MRSALIAILFFLVPTWLSAEVIGSVTYKIRVPPPNDHVVIESFQDPKIPGITCYVARADRGGITGALGVAEDPDPMSLECHRFGPVSLKGIDLGGEQIFTRSQDWAFKKLRVSRFFDPRRNTLIYLAWSAKLVNGSPENHISAVPLSE